MKLLVITLAAACAAHLPAAQPPAPASELERAEARCAAGDAAQCLFVGHAYGTGEKVAFDMAKAARAYERACSAELTEACSALGALLLEHGTDADVPRAVTLERDACARGNALGCANLGELYHDGRGVERDIARAFALAGQACDAQQEHAC